MTAEVERCWSQAPMPLFDRMPPMLWITDALFEQIRTGQCLSVSVNDGEPAVVVFQGIRCRWHYIVREHDVARRRWVLCWPD